MLEVYNRRHFVQYCCVSVQLMCERTVYLVPSVGLSPAPHLYLHDSAR